MDIVYWLRGMADMLLRDDIDPRQFTVAADEIERLRKVLQEIADKDGWCSAKAVAKRLREAGYVDINTIYKMAEEAADEIELLRNERDRLREALQKIYDDDRPEYIPEIMIKHLYSHYTIARDALNGEDE